jgi:hypothetical protein
MPGLMGVKRPLMAMLCLVLAACGVGAGDIRVANGNELACTQERAPALQLQGKLDDEPDAERVALTYAVIVNDREGPFPDLPPTAIPVTDPTLLTVSYLDERTRGALCQQVAFDTYTQDGERSFVVRMLRERDQDVLAEGHFAIMVAP